MARFLIATDSYRGTLSSLEAGRTIAQALRQGAPGSRARVMAVSDGGEGTIEALAAMLGGDRVPCEVSGPTGAPVRAEYAVLADGTAVIEMASACGARLAPEGSTPGRCTTRGVGELVLDAARRGCERVCLGVGSSATTDGGTGAAWACGVRFLDRYVEPFEPFGATLGALESIDASQRDPVLAGVSIEALCAVDTPLCGAMGTSSAFAPTKGALPGMVATLDRNLAHLAEVARRDVGADMLSMPCGGAGGGMGAGAAAFLGARVLLGADAILDRLGFDERLAEADYAVTGEGGFDAMSLHGKVVARVAKRCRERGVPLVAFVGTLDGALAEAGAALGVTTFAVLNPSNRPLDQIVRHPREQLARAALRVGELVSSGTELPAVIEPL